MVLSKERLSPPVIPFPDWYASQAWELRQGMHVLLAGPTQSGKTVLCRLLVRFRGAVVVLGTKKRDPSLQAYIDEGYLRIDHWPATRAEIRKATWEDGSVRLLVWPKVERIEDMDRYRPLFLKVLNGVFSEGLWTVVIDEGLWMSDRQGLNLGRQLSALAYGSASAGVSMYFLVQRPANLPPITWTSVTAAMLFHMGRTDDVRELASLGTYPPMDVVRSMQNLHGYQFLALPVRAQAEWAISEVSPEYL